MVRNGESFLPIIKRERRTFQIEKDFLGNKATKASLYKVSRLVFCGGNQYSKLHGLKGQLKGAPFDRRGNLEIR